MVKKLLALLLTFVLFVGINVQAASTDTIDKNPVIDSKIRQEAAFEKLQKSSEAAGKTLKLHWDGEKGTPSFVTGKLSEKPVKSSEEAAAFLIENKDLFKLKNAEANVKTSEKDSLGMTHYRTIIKSEGIPVYGQELIIHTAADGIVYAINGRIDGDIPSKPWKKSIKLSEQKAISAALEALGLNSDNTRYVEKPSAELYIYNAEGIWQPVYAVRLQLETPYPADMRVFVNAEAGNIVKYYNSLKDGAVVGSGTGVLGQTRTLNTEYVSGAQLYYLDDLTRGALIATYNALNENALGTVTSDFDNKFISTYQAPAVDAHYYMAKVYDYYKNTFARNSYDNSGSIIKTTVHYGINYNNAFWNGSYIAFGDGDGTKFRPLSASLDVAGHEFTHAVIDSTCNLDYSNQSGALNESMADVFGYLIEGDASDWQIGEDCYTPNIAGDALRSMSNPTLFDQPDHMNNYLVTTEDSGGVHTNSGIPNKAFYNISTAIGNTKAAQIYYRAMTRYLTITSQFADARNALLQSAADLYGANGTEYQAVNNGFAAVGIGTSTPPANDIYEPNNMTTEAYGPLTSGTAYNSYIYSANDVDYYYINAGAGTINITLTNLPKDYDIALLNEAGVSVGGSANTSTSNESISYTAGSAGKYYIKVIGDSGAYSASASYTLKATYTAQSSGSTGTWYYEALSLDSPHDYTANYTGTTEYSKPGATKTTVHFSRLETEKGYDFVIIKDKNGKEIARYDGTVSAFWATVDGDKLTITLTSDGSIQKYGYHVDQVGYYANSQL